MLVDTKEAYTQTDSPGGITRSRVRYLQLQYTGAMKVYHSLAYNTPV